MPGDPIVALRAPEHVKDGIRRSLAGLTNYFYEDHILPMLRNAA